MQISDYSPRKSEAELACTLFKINIAKNIFPNSPPPPPHKFKAVEYTKLPPLLI